MHLYAAHVQLIANGVSLVERASICRVLPYGQEKVWRRPSTMRCEGTSAESAEDRSWAGRFDGSIIAEFKIQTQRH